MSSKNTRIFLIFVFTYCLAGWVLLGSGDEIFIQLHLGLDVSIGILLFLLALFVWGSQQYFEMQRQQYLALSFGFAAVADLVHTMAGLEWGGEFRWIVVYSNFLRPATLPPATYMLPIALAWSLWLIRRKSELKMSTFALGMCAVSLVLYALTFSIPSYVDTGILGIQRPTQAPLPFLWAGVIYSSWQMRRRHPQFEGIALMGVILLFTSLFTLYSSSPHEKLNMMAHTGMLLAYCMLHVMLMRAALKYAQLHSRMESTLREQEKKLRAIFEGSNDAVMLLSDKGFMDCNMRALSMFGAKRRQEIIACHPADLSPPLQPDGRDSFSAANAHFQYALEHGVHRFEWVHRRKSGETFPAEVMLSTFDYDGARLVQGTVRDISRRKQAEARITRVTHLYHALSEINQGIVRMSDEAELFPLVCRMAVDFGGMKMAWIGQLNPANGLIEPIVSYGSGLEYLDGIVISANADVPQGCGPTGTAYRENRSVIVNDFELNTITAPWHARAIPCGFLSSAAFPIPRANRPFAVFSVYSGEVDAFDEETIALLDEMSKDISFALDTLDRDKQGRAAQERLRESEQRWKFAVEGAGDGVWDWNIQTSECVFSKRWMQLLGFTEDEIGSSFGEWSQHAHPIDEWVKRVHPDDKPSVMANVQAYFDGKTSSYACEYRIICKDGSLRWLLDRGIVVSHTEDGKPLRMIGIYTDITSRKRAEEQIIQLAHFDVLTNLPNRVLFLDRLEQGAKKSDRAGLPLALLLIDLDQFKEVNDTLGHDVGDTLLQEAARRIRACVRESDTVARLGGDEFTVTLPELHDNSHIEDIANKIINKLAEPFHLGNEVAYVSASIGITLYPNDAASIDALMKNADQAMYVAKNKGRNRFSYFTPALQEAAQTRLRLSNDLRGALAANQFQVYFQPIVELSTGRIYKAEALLRWQHPAHGKVSPMEFIPLAENMGLINEIGDWVFRESAQWAKRWSKQFVEDFKISVNMSPVQFRAEGNAFAAEWLHHLLELGISGKNIVVEITEGLLLNAESDIIDKLLVFRDAGIQVAIDDFGTGYSSLSYLKKFDIDYLKIDQSFVHGLETDPNDMALCEAIIVMAHKLGLKVIAEGVETEGQRRLLAAAGCDFAQGYLFARPAPPEEFEKLLS